MSLLSYQLQTKRYQRELNLDTRKLNALDVKYSTINLLKHLQILNPIIVAPSVAPESIAPENTGFWGNVTVQNDSSAVHRYMDAYLAYNDVPLTNTQRIHGDTEYTFNVAEENRLPLVSSLLQLKVTFQNGTESIDIDAYDGFEPSGVTSNPLDEENTLDMLVNANNYNDGVCSITFVVSYDPH